VLSRRCEVPQRPGGAGAASERTQKPIGDFRRSGRVVSRLPLRCAEQRLFTDGLTMAAPAGATPKPAPNQFGNRVLREPVANQRLRRWVPLRAVL